MKKNKTHTLIISDLHLGSMVSRSKDVKNFLDNFEFEKLVLVGDVFESLDFDELKKEDWDLLTLFAELARIKKVRWVIGNHDKGLTKMFAVLTGIETYNSYRWQYKNVRYLAIHGHQFDNFLINNVVLGNIVNQIYNFIQLIDFSDRRMSRFIKRQSKGWLRVSKKVANRAILYAKVNMVDCIFCGHTHKSMKMRRGNTRYYNSGCWTDSPATYITIDKKVVKIHKYK